jgi:hypothetical protein
MAKGKSTKGKGQGKAENSWAKSKYREKSKRLGRTTKRLKVLSKEIDSATKVFQAKLDEKVGPIQKDIDKVMAPFREKLDGIKGRIERRMEDEIGPMKGEVQRLIDLRSKLQNQLLSLSDVALNGGSADETDFASDDLEDEVDEYDEEDLLDEEYPEEDPDQDADADEEDQED